MPANGLVRGLCSHVDIGKVPRHNGFAGSHRAGQAGAVRRGPGLAARGSGGWGL